jgi:PAS domain S-box-containing protein
MTHKTLPWGLALGVGALLTAGLVGFDSIASRVQREEALLQQEFRAEDLAANLDAQLASSEQVLDTLAELASEVHTPRTLERLMERTFRSTSPLSVHGIGVYFAPYRFDPKRRYMGPYYYNAPDGRPTLTYEWSTPAYDYPSQPWYESAVVHEGTAVYTEPYWDGGMVYLSTVRSFSDPRGRVLGVVAVDVTLPQLQRLAADASVNGTDLLYVTTPGGALIAHPQARELLAWAQGRGMPVRALTDLHAADLRLYEREHGLEETRHTATHALQRAGWTVHISTDKAALLSGVRRLHVAVLLCGVALWGGLLAAAFAARRSLRVLELSRALIEEARTRNTLAASERKLRQVLQTALDGVVTVDARGRIIEWNARAEEMFGWRADEVLGRPAVETLLPEGARARGEREWRQGLARAAESFRTPRHEAVALHRDGHEFPVEVSTTAVLEDGQPVFYAFLNDITERHRKDAQLQQLLGELRQRTAELHAILDNMVDGVLVADTEGHLPLYNPAAAELFGLGRDGEPRLAPDALRHCGAQSADGEPLPFEALPLVRALRGEVVLDAALRIPAPRPGERSRVIRTSAAPIRDEAGQVVAAVALARDVTQAAELERLKDEFLRVAAHELKTPVAVMKSYAQLALKTNGQAAPGLRRLLEGVGRGADRLDQVIRTLLDASQVHLGALRFEPEALELRARVEAAAARASAQHPRHAFHVQPGPCAWVHGDGERLGQVLLELMDNAARYSPAGTIVEVRLEREDGEVEVAIRDEGVGIPVEQQARLFERFYRPHSGTPHDRGGMGLGLYLAREIARLHGGQLLLESAPGHGTTVRLRLPSQPSAHPPSGRPYPGAHHASA